jgi:RNA polymerase sigma-70 factor (ECF subfamily)
MRDAPSFDEFYAVSFGRLLGQLTAMTSDPELARDVVQEGYARAWARWGRVSRLDNPEAWVRVVAWRAAVSRWRRRRVAQASQHLVARPESTEDPDVATAVAVRAALARIPAPQRQALVLYELCGLSVEQVARETGVAVGTVKSRLSRGRAALGELLGDTLDEREAEEVADGRS